MAVPSVWWVWSSLKRPGGLGYERAQFGMVERRTALDASTAASAALPVDAYLDSLVSLAERHAAARPDRVLPAIAAGNASSDVVRRVAREALHVARWTTPELALLTAQAPDGYAFTMDDALHYRHWAGALARETGYCGGPGEVSRLLAACRRLGLSDDDVRMAEPLAETIAATCTLLYYLRASYEEGLAVLAVAGPRLGIGDGGVVAALERRLDPAAAPPTASAPALRDLLRAVAGPPAVQARCRLAIRNVLLAADARVDAMNRWLG